MAHFLPYHCEGLHLNSVLPALNHLENSMTKDMSLNITTALLLIISTHTLAGFEPLPLIAPAPSDNPSSAAKINLGKQLFFDPRLSLDGTISCNTCHDVSGNGTDSAAVSTGIGGQKGERSSPTIWNAAFLSSQFWDGRAATLEEQAKGPILNPIEMGMPHQEAAVERIAAIPGYRKQFAAIFDEKNPVTYDNIAKAIAAYERTLITPNSPFDRFLRGDKTALSAQAQKGMKEFEEIGCILCHKGPALAGPSTLKKGEIYFQWFPAISSHYDEKYKLKEDLGYNQGNDKAPTGKWRVPTLRNIALTAPYFHNGSVKTLNEAVRVMARAQRNRVLTDQQAANLVAFLESLTGEFVVQKRPELPPMGDEDQQSTFSNY
ncbi:Cytochrome c551 peroxidase [hydrothermal vent metagenome]|uniref:Cytochrome c551 peroxidase n=1 Tax=hydrothermal vent metagenome TaxID=652676 RepID=A0A3B1A536_9ZZZZ